MLALAGALSARQMTPMNKTLSVSLALFAAASLSAQEASHGHSKWYDDFDKAVAVAKKEKKDLLVDFTGSDWCGWCIRLHKEVFDHKEFDDGVKDNFVLVALDFPRGQEAKDKVPNPTRNSELQKKYGVRGFPTILLMDVNGEVYGKTGYAAGGPAKYVESLNKMRTVGKKAVMQINDIATKFETAKDDAQNGLRIMALELMTQLESDQMGIEKLGPIVAPLAKSADAKLSEKAIGALLKTGQADEATIAKAVKIDPKNEKGLFEHSVAAAMGKVRDDASAKAFITSLDQLIGFGAKDKELFEGLLFNATRWSFGPLKNKEGAVKYAKLLKANAKDPKQHEKLLEQVLGEGK